MTDPWIIAAILSKALLYLGILGAAGSVFAARLIGPDLGAYRRVALVFAILGIFASWAVFALRGVTLTGDATGASDPEILNLLLQTPAGNTLLLQIVGLGLLIGGLVLSDGKTWLSIIGGFLALWSFAQVGHIARIDDIVMSGLLVLHLAAISFWIGVLIPLRRLTQIPSEIWRAGNVAHRFGLICLLSLPALLAAGGYMAYVLVGSVEALLSTDYGRGLIVKLVFVFGLLVIAAVNKLRFVPILMKGYGQGANALAKTIRFEWVLFYAVMIATAALTTVLTPPAI